MAKISTEQYLQQIDHALDGLATETTDVWRLAEIGNIRHPIRAAIAAFIKLEPDAEEFAQEKIELLRDRIDAIAADPETAGYAEQFRDTWPSPEPTEN